MRKSTIAASEIIKKTTDYNIRKIWAEWALSQRVHIIIIIFMIFYAPIEPLLKLIDEMLGTFYLHQYIFATTVRTGVYNIDLTTLEMRFLHELFCKYFGYF